MSASNEACCSFKSLISLLKTSRLFLASVISFTRTFTSTAVSFSLSSRYFSALSFCLFKGPTCFSNSATISPIRSKFSLVRSNLRIDSSFLFLYLETPAASSKIPRLSSGLLSAKEEIFPCEIIESEYIDQWDTIIKN